MLIVNLVEDLAQREEKGYTEKRFLISHSYACFYTENLPASLKN